MKRSLEWHDECLKNMMESLTYAIAKAERAAAEVVRLEKDADHYRRQIFEARRRGMTEFDSERLLRTAKVKEQ